MDELAGGLDPVTDLLGLLGADLLLHLLTDGGGHRAANLLRHSLALLARQRDGEADISQSYLYLGTLVGS